MDNKTYEGARWTIVHGRYEGVEEYAINELYKVIQQYVPYILTVKKENSKQEEFTDNNIAFIGTEKTNRYISEFQKKGTIKINQNKEGYTIKVCKSPFNNERDMVIIAGADENGVLYGVRDFEHYYSDLLTYAGDYNAKFHKPYIDPMPEFELSSSPAVENRGLWTWGHVIYDYSRYLDNMSRYKMNTVIIWNDFKPLNAKKVLDYAHSRGIKVIWGFSWCWGEKVNPGNKEDLDSWTEKVVNVYEQEYLQLGGDGIYFQTFTETSDSTLDGLSIARSVTKWVNHIAGRLLKKYPELWIQFGLHATSVKDECEILKNIDSRINITWEDAGSFPYSYHAKDVDTFSDTLKFTSKICKLRGRDEDFGIVVKGLMCLNWPTFEHQKGVFIMGEANEGFIKQRAKEKEIFWRYEQSYWMKNLQCALEIVREVKNTDIKRLTITALVEDGMWEEKLWQPVALFAELLWNPNESADSILHKVSMTRDVFLA